MGLSTQICFQIYRPLSSCDNLRLPLLLCTDLRHHLLYRKMFALWTCTCTYGKSRSLRLHRYVLPRFLSCLLETAGFLLRPFSAFSYALCRSNEGICPLLLRSSISRCEEPAECPQLLSRGTALPCLPEPSTRRPLY